MDHGFNFIQFCEQEFNGRIHRFVRPESGQPGVAILISCEGRFLLLECERPITGRPVLLEIPRGFSDGEPGREAAEREVFEETGLRLEGLKHLGTIFADSGTIAVPTEIYHATSTGRDTQLDPTEGIRGAKWLTYEELRRAATNGEIVDSFTLVALTLFSAHNSISTDAIKAPELRHFFLAEAGENMRHTDSKTNQFAAGVAAATAAFVALAARNKEDFLLSWNLQTFLALVALSLWSLAATTKMLRYRAWREHYLKSLQQMTGNELIDGAPLIFRPSDQVEPRGFARLQKRFLGDESFTGVSLLVTISSVLTASTMALRASLSESSFWGARSLMILTIVTAANVACFVSVYRAVRFRVR